MSTNAELARIFDNMAAALELTGANGFRVNAHAKAARVLSDLTTDVSTLVDDPKSLTDIDGIGKGTADRIVEYVQTGAIADHDKLMAKVPAGLFELFEIPGLGPKTVKTMWEKANVTDMASLKKALDDGTLTDLPRIGPKLLENIKASMEFVAKGAQRSRIGKAHKLAVEILNKLRKIKGIKQLEYAGSLRRGCETIGDIDILASTARPHDLSEAFCGMPGVTDVLASGETKCSVRLDVGVQVDLRIVDDAAFGAALLYFTGSKAHNVRLRERAIKQKLRLNEYGLFPDEGDDKTPPQQRGIKPVAAKTEKEIYKKLNLPWIAPELREDRGELAAADDGTLPTLIELADIKAELHAHTVASDGKFTIDELIQQAIDRGYHTIAITDHSKSSAQANGLSDDRLRKHIDAIHEAGARYEKITVLAGSEVDIHADGSLDYDDELLAQLDIVVASPHASLRQEPDKATKRLLAAIRHPLVNILGHPTGRIINRREGLSPDMGALIAAAVQHNTALELNANFMRLDLRDTHVRAAVKAGAQLAINTDTHSESDFDHLPYGVLTARRGWLEAKQCINTWSASKLHKWLNAKR
jgi:DNA polymerase (family 10)